MENKKKERLAPYDMVLPGFEAVYTGEKSPSLTEKVEVNTTLTTDDAGNVIKRWSTWTWTWPGEEKDWDDEIKYINNMQMKLGPLNDKIRQIRAHIGSLVLCDNGVPVTIDELLNAIGRGELSEHSFHNGCWCGQMWWDGRGTQPFQNESMQAIYEVLTGYLAGETKEKLIEKFPYAKGFINRSYEWLGPATELTKLQKLMMERMLLPFEYFTGRKPDYEVVNRNCFEEGGRGVQIDAEISALAGLPKIYMDYLPQYRENLNKISDPQKRELYKICCHIAHGVHGLSDCHHNTFRYIENWIYGIGTGKFNIPTRRQGAERERLGRLLFGYALGLDKWLLGIPMQLFLLDLGHIDLGFDPRSEILRVYAYLGDEKSPVKEWLAACLWYNLSNNPHGGLHRHKNLLERARQAGISLREWMNSVLEKEIQNEETDCI
jgi:hypothetical protein